jgi:hypothetical protein
MPPPARHTYIKKRDGRRTAASDTEEPTMTWTISYQYMMTATGPQMVAIGRYEPSYLAQRYVLGPNLSAHEARATAFIR